MERRDHEENVKQSCCYNLRLRQGQWSWWNELDSKLGDMQVTRWHDTCSYVCDLGDYKPCEPFL